MVISIAKIPGRARVVLLAVTLTLVAGPAALATPDIGMPLDIQAGSAAGSTYLHASEVGPGLDLGDGTFEVSVSCEAGDRVLSGWSAGVNGTSTLLQSSPKDPSTWSVRVNKNGLTDDYSAEVLCADLQGSTRSIERGSGGTPRSHALRQMVAANGTFQGGDRR
jgi:hypothetical protein